MTAHDDLRRQLTASVQALAVAPGSPGPRRRWRGSHRGLAVVVLALACGGGVATAATQLLRAREPGDERQARTLVQRAVRQASALAVCQPASARLVDGDVLPEIERVFPARSAPLSPQLRKAVLRHRSGAVLASSVRLVRFPAGERLLVFATQGPAFRTPADPDGCDRAQRDRLLKLHPEEDAVRRIAVAMLAREQARPPGSQTLTMLALRRGGAGGTGIRAQAGRPLPTGVMFHGGSSLATVYGGIAVAGARTVTLTSRPHAKRPLRRTIGVRERLFAFTLPRGTGPLTLRQRAADGSTLAMQRIRG